VLPLNSHFSASVDAARAAAAVGEHRMAVEHYSRAITINNSRPDLWLGRAMSRLQLKDAQGALDDTAGAIARGLPENETLMVRAQAAQLLGKPDDAMAQLDRVIAADPGARDARKMRAGLNANGGSLDKALADVDAILALDPSDIDAKSLRAEIYLRRADWPSAASAFTALAQTSKGQSKLWIGAGVALLGMGANGEAQAAFDHAQSDHQAGSDVRSAALLGQALALRALGRLDAALNAWNVYSAVSRLAVAPSLHSIEPDEKFLKRIYFEIASRPRRDDGFVPGSEEPPPGPQSKP
jgi:tetratricopeptide (TPR) repeat protein